MALMGQLTLHLVARYTQLERGLKAVQQKLARFTAVVSKIGRIVAPVAAATAAFLGARNALRLLFRTMEEMRATKLLASRLGTTAAAMVGFRYAARYAGIEQEKMTYYLEKFQNSLGLAVTKGGDAARMFKRLGLDARTLTQLPLPEQIGLVTDRIKRLGTAEERAAAASTLFGRKGWELLNIIEMGSAGLERARRATELLGVTFTPEMAEKANQAIMAVHNLKLALTGLAQRATAVVAPAIARVANLWAFRFASLGDITRLVVWQMQLDVVRLMNQIIYVFTKAIPYALGWFARNWETVFGTLAINTETLFRNLAGNIVRVIKNVPALVAGTVDMEKLWKPLTEGFLNLIQEKFVLPERIPGEMESVLAVATNEMRGMLERRWELFKQLVIDVPPLEIPPDTLDTMDALAEALKSPAAMERGTREAYSAGLQPQLRALDTYFRQSTKVQGEAVKELQEVNRNLRNLPGGNELAIATF